MIYLRSADRRNVVLKKTINRFSQFTNLAHAKFCLDALNSGCMKSAAYSFLPLLCLPSVKFRCQLQLPHLLSNELQECTQYHKLMITVSAGLRVDISFKTLACRWKIVIASLSGCCPMSNQQQKPSCRCYVSAAGCCFV